MKTLFLDTNIFLQCKDLKQLSWPDISEKENLLLLISRPVREEIDALKSDGNSRRAKRARNASSLFKDIFLSEDSVLIIRKDHPKVEISFSPDFKLNKAQFDSLDLTRSDDQIIGTAITYKKENPGSAVAILSHDTNLLLTARDLNFPHLLIPDKWLLEPESDSRDKKILELEKRIRELEKLSPQIEIHFPSSNNENISTISLEVIQYKPLLQPQIDQLVNEARLIFPIVTQFSSVCRNKDAYSLATALVRSVYMPPTAEEIQEYTNKLYPNWIAEIENFFKSLHIQLEKSNRSFTIKFYMSNNGSVPAENIVVEIRTHPGINFIDKSEKEEKIKFPKPPKAPEGKFLTDMMNTLNTFHLPNSYLQSVTHERDRHSFYRKESTESFRALECDEFRHQIEPEAFNLHVLVSPEKNIEKGALQILITAKNLPKPVNFALSIQIKYIDGNTFDKACELISSKQKFRRRP